ncbi:diguanylate cyclase domain-containing protein [Azotosporobacter soli]|uniref:diguanylate cyclase domain-containing protein n=1 Tax=Azotosporobacter soli TaxID=3055040 RepID=UPI0031FEB4C7
MLAREYELGEKMYESTTSILYRATTLKDRKAVVLKMSHEEYPGPEKEAQLRYEYELTKEVSGPSVIKALDLIEENGTNIIVYEDFGGMALNDLDCSKWRMRQKITLFLKVIDGLSTVHSKAVIHKDLNPANIVLNQSTGQVKLIDFGNATRLTRENIVNVPRPRIEGTLAYMAPEQTGRMNRIVDYRADYYALGATFYEIMSNQFLFPHAQDSVELMHCLLAKEPKPLTELNEKIPPMLSRIVMKLLAKNAEDRYQSLYGVKADLENCLDQLENKGRIDDFMLGQKDDLGKFEIPQRLYGRKQELTELISGYEKVYRGGFEMLLITGPSGVGKSLLVSELQKAVIQGRGYFVTGKYEKHKHEIPYSALLDAFRDLVRVVLTEPEEKIAQLKTRLKEKLAANGRIITDVVPEVKFIIGEQAAVEELTPVENKNRFHFVFREFISAFVGSRQTLVIFLDDLQWVDDASIELLRTLALTKEHGYLYLIGAYRKDGINELHPLSVALEEMEKRNGRGIKTIHLMPLGVSAISELLADALKSDVKNVQALAELIHHKTDGVPFFINEILLQLEKQHLIWLDYQAMCWKWDLAGIKNAGISDSMVGLLSKRINSQDENTQRVLGMAALVGNRFDFTLLSELDPNRQHLIAAALWNALQEGFIQPLDPAYKYIQDAKVDSVFRFFHDSIQQAAQSLLSETQRMELHLRIGRILREQEKTVGGESRIFDMVRHLNAAQPLISDPAELRELGALNYWAGKRAKKSSAFSTSLVHFHRALELLGTDAWQKNPALALDVYVQAATVAYSCGAYAMMQTYSDSVFVNCQDPFVRVSIYEIQIRALLASGKAGEGVELARTALSMLGVNFPRKIAKPYLLLQLTTSKFFLQLRGLESLEELPALRDQRQEAIMRILAAVSSSAYLAAPELFVLMVLKQVEITVKYGKSSRSPFAYCLYGVIVGGVLGDLGTGYKFAKFGLEAIEKGNYQEAVGKTMLVGNLFAAHWKDPLKKVIAEFMRAYRVAMADGDLEYAAWALMAHGFHSFFSGAPLADVEADLLAASEKIKSELCQETQYAYTRSFAQLVGNLRRADNLEGQDEAAQLMEYQRKNDSNGLYYTYSNKMLEQLFLGQQKEALASMRMAKLYLESVLSTINHPVFYYYSTLIYLIEYDSLSDQERNEIGKQMKRLKVWAKTAPHTHGYKYRFLQAEMYAHERNYAEASTAFDEAIEAAKKNEFLQDAALANERAAEFYQKQDKETIARSYRMAAYHLYRQWGAESKAKRLRDQYLYLWMKPEESIAALNSKDSLRLTAPQAFDWASIVKIAQMLSSEMNYEQLIVKMMSIVMENAGAQRGVFLAQVGLELKVEGRADMAGSQCRIFPVVEAEAGEDAYSIGIVNYVLRTEESLVIQNALTDRLFANDPYVLSREPISILCMPVCTQKKIIGVLYLENNLIKGAFTPERIEILQVVASQSAISLENINVYQQLEEKVQERTCLLNERTRELENAYEEVKYISMHDALTGLYNRAYFEQEMQRLGKRRQGGTGVLVCDMDGLKRINDSQGHEAGDKMLQAAADVLRKTFRPCDMVARIGGDEFAVLVPDADRLLMERLKERIQTAVEQYNEKAGATDLSISVGLSLQGNAQATMLDTFKEADERMYQEKVLKPNAMCR